MSPNRLCLTFALASWLSPPVAADPGWKLVKEGDGIRIHTRAVPGAEIRQLRAETRLRATVEDLLAAYLDVDLHVRWYPGCVAARRVRDENGSSVFYHRIANPWPVKDRDYAFAIDTAAAEEPGGVMARYRDVKGRVPEVPGCVRMRKLEGYWKFVPEPDGFTAVTYVFDFDPGPGAPAAFINMSLPRIGDNMLEGMARGAGMAAADRRAGSGRRDE